MLRWLMLGLTLGAWLAMMWLVQANYGPRPLPPQALASRATLEALFGERASPHESWSVYTDPARLQALDEATPVLRVDGSRFDLQAKRRAAEEAGAGPGEVHIGKMELRLTTREETRAELLSNMDFALPETGQASFLHLLGRIHYESRANFSRDRGLEEFSSKCEAGIGVEVLAVGHREGDRLRIMVTVNTVKGGKVLSVQHELPLAGVSAPSLALSPFLDRPQVRVGERWEVATLDTTSASGEARLAAAEVRVTGRASIRYHGRATPVLRAEAEHGQQTLSAYYSPDGRALVQHYRFANMFDLTLVRDEEP